MNVRQQIDEAFAHRARPTRLVDGGTSTSPERMDALWFEGRDWRSIVRADWESHPDALFAFTPEALAYYLPSILATTMDSEGQWLQVADSLIGALDRSPRVEFWDAFLSKRFVGLKPAEYEVLQAWLLSLSGLNDAWEEDTLTRAYETVELLKQETERVRRLVGGPSGV
ncbi:MAG: hypothetical protein JF586_24250 [Burkholderiales bacterium]|jgi:hypothetical protein|nr:hypothetical protein [Burkholderiales bacterium]